MNKVLENLKAFNANAEARAKEAEQKAKVDAVIARGMPASVAKETRFITEIFKRLKALDSRVKLVEAGVRNPNWPEWMPAYIELPTGYYVSLHFNEVWSQGHGRFGFGSKPTGKLTLHVGPHGRDGRTFRELKDGTMKYGEIASEIYSRMQDQLRKAQAEMKARHNLSAVETVKGCSLDEPFRNYYGVSLSSNTSDDKPVTVKIDKTLTMSAEAATELLNVLRKHGIG